MEWIGKSTTSNSRISSSSETWNNAGDLQLRMFIRYNQGQFVTGQIHYFDVMYEDKNNPGKWVNVYEEIMYECKYLHTHLVHICTMVAKT